MSNKQTFVWMLVLFVLVGGYLLVLKEFVYPKHPEWFQTPPPVANSTVSSASEPATQLSSTSPSTIPGMSSGTSYQAVGAEMVPDVNLGAAGVGMGDTVGLTVSAIGAGLDSAIIPAFRATDTKGPYTYQTPYEGHPESSPLATQSITVNGQSLNLISLPWKLESNSADSATYSVDVLSGQTPLVELTKTYQVHPAPTTNANNTADGYEVDVDYQVKNLAATPQTVSIEFSGPTMPPREIERSDDRQIVMGYDKGDKTVNVVRNTLADFKPETADKDITHDTSGRSLLWAGDCSVYFGAIVEPQNPEQILSVHAVALNPDALAPDRVVVLNFTTTDQILAPQASAEIALKAFLGPKERSILEGDYYSDFPRTFNQLLATSSGFCAICALPWLVDRLVDLLNVLHFIFRDWGLAIIALVILVRLILHPITKSSQVSMMKMQKMGPELERLKKKHADDKDAFAKAQMEMYKEMGVSPFLGCLPMFLQMPIWIALYSALQSVIQLRQAPFLWGFTWIHDLARPDRLITWDHHPFTLPIIGTITSFNLLPILMGIVMFIQQRMQPMPTATPEQEQQRKMMTWMSLLFSLFLYLAPSGLNLYIFTSTGLGIIESRRIRAHIKELEERDKNKTIIDAKPTRQAKLIKKEDPGKPKKKGLWERMQEWAENMRKEAEKKSKNKDKDKDK
ncbi:MAG: YidC/Oxa1 family insertase periplasmic-domain containing protein [Tepidisphaeraceae bacterium]|jgi:YidC/Oxa1 family membrane protein insertase